MTAPIPPSFSDSDVILLPTDRFFVRLVPLAPDAGAAAQVELALEGCSPFPLAQLYYGYLPAPAGTSALVFAAYRKRFTAEETQAWRDAEAVWPAFLALLGGVPAQPTIRLQVEPLRLTAVAWNGIDPLPVAVLAREVAGTAEDQRATLLGELRSRANIPAAIIQEFTGPVRVSSARGSGRVHLELSAAAGSGGINTVLDAGGAQWLDVRDKEFLDGRRATARRDRWLWRALQTCAGGLAAALALEALLLGGNLALQRQRETVRQHAAEVRKIETAQTLGARIEELSVRRLMPFEMLAVVNQARPASIQFLRTTTADFYSLEIEAQTGNAADAGQYEAALRARPELASVETRDLRSRDGITSFVLTVTFKPESLHGGPGA